VAQVDTVWVVWGVQVSCNSIFGFGEGPRRSTSLKLLRVPELLSWWPETGTNCDFRLGMKPALQFPKLATKALPNVFQVRSGYTLMATPAAEVYVQGPPFWATVLRWDLPPRSVPSEQDLTVLTLESAFLDAQAVSIACTWPGRTDCRVFLQILIMHGFPAKTQVPPVGQFLYFSSRFRVRKMKIALRAETGTVGRGIGGGSRAV